MRLLLVCCSLVCSFFFFNDTATTEIYTLSLHDALPICAVGPGGDRQFSATDANGELYEIATAQNELVTGLLGTDRKSTRLNSSHQIISYAVFCLKKKNTQTA